MTTIPDAGSAALPSPPQKKAWQTPAIEEISYTATEVAGIPGAVYDGFGLYSAP